MGPITMAVNELYHNYQEVDYNAQYDLLPAPRVLPPQPQENRLDIDPTDDLPMWHSHKPVMDIQSLSFRYQPHSTSNANQRDTLYYGSIKSRGRSLILWGFPSYQEFRDHLSVSNKLLARDVWEQLKCDYAGTGTKFIFWVAKSDIPETVPGCWAISVISDTGKDVIVYANGSINHYGPLRHPSQQNTVKIAK
jgi:hypothetical protein